MLIIYPLFSVPVVLVGNKTDLHQERTVSTEDGKKLAESWRAAFLETSAKQNEVRGAYYIRYIDIYKITMISFVFAVCWRRIPSITDADREREWQST